jgi:hypothetical protein
VTDRVTVALEHVEDRQLLAGLVLAVIVVVVVVVAGRDQSQVPPAAIAGEGADPVGVRLGDDGEVDPLREVRRRAVERVEDRRARWARRLVDRELRGLARGGAGPGVARVARKHEAVDDERVPPGGEQLREPHSAVIGDLLEGVVLGEDAARRQCPPQLRDPLGRPPQLDLGFEQAVALAAVVVGFAGEADLGVGRQGGESTLRNRSARHAQRGA